MDLRFAAKIRKDAYPGYPRLCARIELWISSISPHGEAHLRYKCPARKTPESIGTRGIFPLSSQEPVKC